MYFKTRSHHKEKDMGKARKKAAKPAAHNPTHILFIGGKKHNIPPQRMKCQYTQYEQDSTEIKRGEISLRGLNDQPDMVMCFIDFMGHGNFDAFKSKCALLGIPFIASSGG